VNVSLWEHTLADELEGNYDRERGILISHPPSIHGRLEERSEAKTDD
jgi:hypothetical protein